MTGAQDAADALSDLLAGLETTTRDALTGTLRRDLDELAVESLGRWVQAFGGVERAPEDPAAAAPFLARFVAGLTAIMDPQRIDPDAAAGALHLAYAMGLDHAAGSAWWRPEISTDWAPRPRADLSGPIAQQAVRALSGLSAAILARRGYLPVQESMVRARMAAHRIHATIAYELTSAAAQAVRDVAAERGAAVLWVAERDGCLHCLAYAGEVATTPGGTFRTGLTFGDRPLEHDGALLGPALHPHCRCVLQVFDTSDVAVAEGLKREAARSVLRGDALDGEAARLRAAARLLDAGSGLPKSVQDRARRAVRAGAFERK